MMMVMVRVFRKYRVAFRRRKQFFEQLETAPQMPAGQLPRTRFNVDIAADAVQIQRHGVFKRLPRIIAERLAVFARAHGTPQHRLLQMPALFVDLAMHLSAQLFAEQARIGILRFRRQPVREKGRELGIEVVMIIGNLLVLDSEEQGRKVAKSELSTREE
jgi:hypothetical protein